METEREREREREGEVEGGIKREGEIEINKKVRCK
jgi:hypothetical protein